VGEQEAIEKVENEESVEQVEETQRKGKAETGR
jgi:hypothetical protein